MFFEKFPVSGFEISKTESIVVTDFIRSVAIDPQLKNDDIFFTLYEAKDNEMPEVISHKAYKTTQYHWVIMLINEKFDPYNDFPKDDATLIKLASEKYTNINDLHHYEDQNGNWVDFTFVGGIPITNIEYERQMNEKKRTIKILKREVLDEFVSSYEQLISV